MGKCRSIRRSHSVNVQARGEIYPRYGTRGRVRIRLVSCTHVGAGVQLIPTRGRGGLQFSAV